MGKSLVAAKDLEAGVTLNESDIAMKSPGGNLPPSNMEKIVGRELVVAVKEDEPFSLSMIR